VQQEPDVDAGTLAGYLRTGFGLTGATVRFLPVGHDALAWSFEVRTAGARYFLKLTRRRAGDAVVRLPRYLHERGLTAVVAPLTDGYEADGYRLLLYPYVDGAPPTAGLTDAQWVAYGSFLGALHATPVPDGVVPDEAYDCPGAAQLRELAGLALGGRHGERWALRLSDFWRHRDGEIAELADHAERLGRAARARRRPHVLCHADIHTNNVLVDAAGGLHVVDWDAPVSAPRERDLMFVTWALADARQEALFRSGYGPLDVDGPVIAYYRYERLVCDLAEFADVVLRRDDLGEADKRHEYEWFVRQFEPGGAVGQARTLDGRLR
jgi:spectinomycin phosphotransferase